MSSYIDGEVLAMTYDIWISGTKLGTFKKSCINSIDIKETVEGADVATIKISDPQFLYIEDNIFIEENTIRIRMGWSNSTYRVDFNGYISAVDIDFGSDGIPNLTITCMDNTHKMNREKKSNTWKNTTSAKVVKEIVQKYGFKCVIDSTYKFTTQETITQSKQTDIDFIQKLAKDEVHPFTARLVGNTFYYTKMGAYTTPSMNLTYKDYPHEIISFSPKINKEYRQGTNDATVNTSDKSVSSASSKTETGEGSASSGTNNKYKTYDPATRKWK